MIDIDYYRKIQNAYGTKTLRDAQRNQVKQDLNKDFNNTLDAYTVTVDGVEQDLTILKTNDSHTKKIKSRPNESFNAGQIVYWKDSYWLINDVDTNNDIITHGKMVECNFILYWQNSLGYILNRHVYVEDFTKYSNGETGNSTITIGDNQYGVYIPIDEDTRKFKRGMRFVFDFEDVDNPDVYSLTNRKVNLYNYEDIHKGGMILLTFSFDAFNVSTDKRVELDNGKKVWICDYHSSTQPSTPPTTSDETTVSILGNTNLKIGYPRIYTAKFTDKDGNDVKRNFKWNLVSDFEVGQTIMDNKIKLRVSNEDCIGSSFLLQILDDNDNKLAETQIEVVELM